MIITPPRSEDELLTRAAALAGRTLRDIAGAAGLAVPPDQRGHKGWVGDLMEHCLGADAESLSEPDFRSIGVELKTLPLNAGGRPAESTWVCTVRLAGDPVPWEASDVRRKLARVMWVPVESDPRIPLSARHVGSALLWSPDAEEEASLRADWEELTGMIALGELERVSARHGQCLQIRPKAADARALTRTAGADGTPESTLPRGFYLRAAFTAAVFRKRGLHTYNVSSSRPRP
jgi:DNA mismatch repair protein MutH